MDEDQEEPRAAACGPSPPTAPPSSAAPPDGALAWMRPEDLFFLQIQGSGVLTFPDGRRMKAVYAADNGQPFVGIARPMREPRHLQAATTPRATRSAAGWPRNRGPEADAMMRLNPRYVFFHLAPDDGQRAGRARRAFRCRPAAPSRSTRRGHAYGELYWIDAEAPDPGRARFPIYRRLAMALDTGGAIRGEVRADLYIGRGDGGRAGGRAGAPHAADGAAAADRQPRGRAP